jgi:hypothetical protein
MDDEIHIIIPSIEEGTISDGLVYITKYITENTSNKTGEGFGLGGEYGYGANFENDVFMIHRYCWCEKEDCPWCEGEEPNFRYKPTGATISWYKYIGRGMITIGNLPTNWIKKCINSIK